MFTFDWLNIKMILSETKLTSRLNLIDRIMQNKLTNTLFGSINIAMATVYMLYIQCQGAFLGDKPFSFKCIIIMNY